MPSFTFATVRFGSAAAASSKYFSAFSKNCWFMYAQPRLFRRAASAESAFFSGVAAIRINAAASSPPAHSSSLDFIDNDLTTEAHGGAHRERAGQCRVQDQKSPRRRLSVFPVCNSVV